MTPGDVLLILMCEARFFAMCNDWRFFVDKGSWDINEECWTCGWWELHLCGIVHIRDVMCPQRLQFLWLVICCVAFLDANPSFVHGFISSCFTWTRHDRHRKISGDFGKFQNFHMAEMIGRSAFQCLKGGLRVTIGRKLCSSRDQKVNWHLSCCLMKPWDVAMGTYEILWYIQIYIYILYIYIFVYIVYIYIV